VVGHAAHNGEKETNAEAGETNGDSVLMSPSHPRRAAGGGPAEYEREAAFNGFRGGGKESTAPSLPFKDQSRAVDALYRHCWMSSSRGSKVGIPHDPKDPNL
jgi:hypothetical protein